MSKTKGKSRISWGIVEIINGIPKPIADYDGRTGGHGGGGKAARKRSYKRRAIAKHKLNLHLKETWASCPQFVLQALAPTGPDGDMHFRYVEQE